MSTKSTATLISALALLAVSLPLAEGGIKPGKTVLVSKGLGNLPANGFCAGPRISADGRHVVFISSALNMTQPGGNGKNQIVLRDMKTGKNTLVSRAGSVAGNDHSYGAQISANGRFIVFSTSATNLLANDTNEKKDVYRFDRKSGNLAKVSVGYLGAQVSADCSSTGVSRNGRFVVFISTAVNIVGHIGDGTRHVYVRDMKTQVTSRVSVNTQGYNADEDSWSATISDDGRFIAFDSRAGNLDPLSGSGRYNVFLRDRKLGFTHLITRGVGGSADGNSYGSTISGNGRYIAFTSEATNLVVGDQNGARDLFVWDRKRNRVQRFAFGWESEVAECTYVTISRNGSRLSAVATKENGGLPDDDEFRTYLVKRKTAKSTLTSVNSRGEIADAPCYSGSISANGQYVVFGSGASNLPGANVFRSIYLRRP